MAASVTAEVDAKTMFIEVVLATDAAVQHMWAQPDPRSCPVLV